MITIEDQGELHWYSIVQSVLTVIVAVSNITVITVWSGSAVRNHVTILLITLAISDLLTDAFPGVYMPIHSFGNIPEKEICILEFYSIYILPFIFHTWSILITCVIAVQRFINCAFPLKAKRIWSKKISYLGVCFTFLFAIGLRIPDGLVYDVDIEKLENSTSFVCDFSFVLNEVFVRKYAFGYLWYIRIFLLQFGSIIVVSFSMIYCSVIIARLKGIRSNQTVQQNRRKTRSTIMTCIIMLIFVIGELPTTLLLFLVKFAFMSENSFVQWFISENGIRLANAVLTISYLLNIWVYIGISKQFRRHLYQSLTCQNTRRTNN